LNPRRPNEEKAVLVIQTIAEKLKPHQIEGIQFLWENIAVSLDKLKKRSDEVRNSSNYCLISMFNFLPSHMDA
jgi:hypothetical protein